MNLVTALAIVIGIMGGLATYGAVSYGSPYLLIWAIFIAWGSYFHSGGTIESLKASILANIWGIAMAVLAFVALTTLGVSALNAGICVGVTVLIMILGANNPLLGAIPAAVYGYAATAALFLLGGSGYGEGAMGIIKVGGAIAISMILGNILGYMSGEFAGILSKKGKYQGGCAHIRVTSKGDPVDNHTCHCNVCKNVTGQLTTHVVFFKYSDVKVTNEGKLNRQPFNADNPDGPLELCTCRDCGAPIMLDDKEKRIRVIVPNLMGMNPENMPAMYHAFYDESKGYARPSDGRPVYDGFRPDFVWPESAA